jgi:hypothetical protein
MRSFALCLAVLSLTAGALAAQDSIPIRVVRVIKDSAGREFDYVVQVRGKLMVAITEAQAESAQIVNAELKGALAKLKARDTLVARYEEALAWSDSTVRRQKELISQLDSLYRGWRDVAGGWKRLSGGARVTFDWGLGMTGSDQKPTILAGLGVSRFRFWGIVQEANAGGAVGMSLRLF